MTFVRFDPFRAQHRLQWGNLVAQWRAERAQTAIHALALTALGVLLAAPMLQALDAGAPLLRDALARWPVAIAALAGVAMAVQLAQRLVSLRTQQARDWLVSQPIPDDILARRRRDRVLRDALLNAAGGVALLAAIQSPADRIAGFLGCVVVAALVAVPLSRRLSPRTHASAYFGSRIADAGIGRLWHWQRVEIGTALRGRSLAFGVWALLLVPMGSGPGAVLAVGISGLLLASLATAWRRSLGVLPQAQAWLGAQPLSGARLLRATCVVPLFLATSLASIVAAALLALGTPGVAAFAALAVLAGSSLQFAATAATRARPRRVPLLFLLHLALLVGLLQAMPPLAALSWPLQLAWLLRLAARP